MRLVEIEITVFEKQHTELIGENDHSTDVKRKCTIDLDRVESLWEDPPEQGGDGILLKFYSGDSLWTKSFTMAQFVSLLKNEAGFQTVQPVNNNLSVGKCTGGSEPCALCQSVEVVQCGDEFTCEKCGFKWKQETNSTKEF